MPRPLTLKPPDNRHQTWWVRGTVSGERFQRTTGESERSEATKWLRKWQREANSGELAPRPRLSFAAAANAYKKAGGDTRFLKPIVDHFGTKTAAEDIDQGVIDAAAVAILPRANQLRATGRSIHRSRPSFAIMESDWTCAGREARRDSGARYGSDRSNSRR